MDRDWQWRSADTLLLAEIADSMNFLAWTKTKDAGKKNPRNRPKPIPRPGVHGYGRDEETVSLPLDEVKRRLARPRRALVAD